jgi:hypothetical protein
MRWVSHVFQTRVLPFHKEVCVDMKALPDLIDVRQIEKPQRDRNRKWVAIAGRWFEQGIRPRPVGILDHRTSCRSVKEEGRQE